ncbi:glucans biosynthesis glucosyltransferase MdoH [Teichococcus rhizosphaerae]|uniref:glucans biosynthesis glucosyltransferase MdoH n=1 Tax=Teichococcus rhizosphaerae TaxID=1335062 RepID=UPI001FEBE118|nr:glucans biosynthesis glucosyltransferase MdoH [Pseudoroseomonas rhizosphaerae]
MTPPAPLPPLPPERPGLRRLAFLLLCLALGLGLLLLMLRVLAPGGWTAWEWVLLAAWLGTLPWSCLCAGNALLGLALRLRAAEPAALVVPQLLRAAPPPPRAATAILVCLRNEAMEAVLPPLARLLDGLEAAGAGHRFTLWFLSDTQEPGLAAREEAGIAGFARLRAGRPVAVRYRRRTRNTGFKAGNVMDFLDHHAGDQEFFLCLDADSEMSAEAVLRLVAAMEADPRLAILQQLIVGRPARSAFTRLFQFGMRAGMRSWATGQAWWQLDQGPYWGHNALLRVAPFRAHARLEALPGGSPILSHDQIEAVRLHAAGWKVRCLPIEEGSLEGNPPTLPDFILRDRRWGAGNMQYWHLLRLPGLTAMGRWQLVQAILLFLSAPLWLLVLVAAVLNAATGGGAATPAGPLAALLLANGAAIHAPKLAGYLELMLRPERAAPYGGRRAVLRGALAEIGFTTLLDPVSLASKALFLLALPFAGRAGWQPQNRDALGVRWADAARLLRAPTLLGAVLMAALVAAGGTAWAWGLPFVAPLLLGIPFAVLTADPRLSCRLRRIGLARTPEEEPPRPDQPPGKRKRISTSS